MAQRRAARDADREAERARDKDRRDAERVERVLEKEAKFGKLFGQDRRVAEAARANMDAAQAFQDKQKADKALADEDKQYKAEMKDLTKKIAENVGAVV